MIILRALVAALVAVVAILATLPVVVLGAPFWIVSGLTHAVRGIVRRSQPPEVAWTELIEFEPELGWKNRSGARGRVRAKCAFEVTTDDEGWRGKGTIEGSDIVVIGDSFAFGHGVNDPDFFADRTSTVRVKSLGADGYNMVQGLLWMERLRERLADKLVVWFVFYGNDLMDNLRPNMTRYRTPFVRSDLDGRSWEIVTEHVSPAPFSFDPSWGYKDKIAEVCTESPYADRAYSACAFLIERAVETLRPVHAQLAIVGIPDPQMLDPAALGRLRRRSTRSESFDPGLPDQRMAEICAGKGVLFLPISKVLKVHDHLPDDCHWTPGGHGKVARAIEELYQRASASDAPIGIPANRA